ncbi:hypothetical protein NHX12_031664 [Muraenolepis orangiensis]|uniref:Meiosis inhibitor protein 1 n=1 Tax=Muraenolepis orangiensis TaxID=630683 RepID=A0A9Q0IKV4_9TELE|nr:hypothetical protein NHX12_031664 [Muraenolepis orangiensis]
MATVDIVYDKFHFRHDPKWTGRLGPQDGGGVMLCVACVIEMMESKDISSVRKCVALSGISGVLRCSPGALGGLLQQDHRVCLHFTASLLGMLRTIQDPAALDQLCDHRCWRSLFPTFTFLGKMVEALPDLAVLLLAQYEKVPFLEGLCSALLHTDQGLKASLFYLWHALLGGTSTAAIATTLSLPPVLRDRLCSALLHTLADACIPELTLNCLGLLKQLVQSREAVSCLMNTQAALLEPKAEQNLSSTRDTQDPETEHSPEHRLLPLILKKLLLSGDELLQVASAQCMAAILVHSPSQYCPPFILADVPEFLFEGVSGTRSEVLLWSLYNCLLLLSKDPLLKETLRLTNLEVQKQGLMLLTEILDRFGPHNTPGCVKSGDPSPQVSRSVTFLIQALMCIQAACRLAEQCVSEPLLKENVFMAPTLQSAAGDSLQSMCVGLLRCCDTVCIPTVTMLQSFYLILSSQFTLLTPTMSPIMHLFASKLDLEELEAVLLRGLPRLCHRVSEWPSLLAEAPDHPDTAGPRGPQHCLLIILMLALEHGDRLLPDHSVFSGVLSLLQSLQEQGDCPMPRPLLSLSSVYTHHPPLLHFIYRYPELVQRLGRGVLELWLSPQTQGPPAQTQGPPAQTAEPPAQTTGPLAQTTEPPAQTTEPATQTTEPPATAGKGEESQGEEVMDVMEQQSDMETRELQSLMTEHPAVVLTLLDMVCTSEVLLAERVVRVLEVFLGDRERCREDLSSLLRPALLQALQRASLEDQHITTTCEIHHKKPTHLHMPC